MHKAPLDLVGSKRTMEANQALDQTLTLVRDSNTPVPSIDTSTFQVITYKWWCQRFNQWAPVGSLVLLVDWNFDSYHITRPNELEVLQLMWASVGYSLLARLLWMSSLPIAVTGEREPDPSKMQWQLATEKRISHAIPCRLRLSLAFPPTRILVLPFVLRISLTWLNPPVANLLRALLGTKSQLSGTALQGLPGVCTPMIQSPVNCFPKVVGRQTMLMILQWAFLFGCLGIPPQTTGVHRERDKPSSPSLPSNTWIQRHLWTISAKFCIKIQGVESPSFHFAD